MSPSPSFDLAELLHQIEIGHYSITRSARDGAASMYLDEDDILDCVTGLAEVDFYKSMESRKRPGTFQDVYRRRYHSFPIYLKLGQTRDGCVVIPSSETRAPREAKRMRECVECGGPMQPAREVRPVRVGKRKVAVEDEFFRCVACGGEAYGPGQMNESMRRATTAIRREDGLLLPDEILAIRTRLGLTQAGFEALLGVGAKTVVRWEKGTVFQNKATDQLLRVLRDVPGVSRYLAEGQGIPV